MTSHAQHTARAGRREWIGLAVIALPCLVYAMDLTVLTLAVPSITADLRPSATELLWIADIYGFLVAGFLITMGVLGDRIGRRRLLFIGAAAFGAASVVAAFAASAGALIASRALLGVAGATLAPSTLSLIRNMFHDPRQRIRRHRHLGRELLGGGRRRPARRRPPARALLVGLGLPARGAGDGAAPGASARGCCPSTASRSRAGSTSRASRSRSSPCSRSSTARRPSRPTASRGRGVAPVLAGIAAGGAFLDRQRRLAAPMVDLALFRTPGFGPALGANTLAFAVVFGLEVLTAQYLQLVLGLSPLTAGLWGSRSRARSSPGRSSRRRSRRA